MCESHGHQSTKVTESRTEQPSATAILQANPILDDNINFVVEAVKSGIMSTKQLLRKIRKGIREE